jgi:hypothetical protein
MLALAFSADAALLVNGDFEVPIQQNNSSQFLPVGTIIPGWTVIGNGGVNVDQTFSPTPFWPGNLTQFMDLTGNTGGGGIQSDPFATTVGQSYTVTFDAFNGSLVSPGTPWIGSAFSLQASGGVLVNYSGASDVLPGVPTVITYSFTADANTSTLTFMDTSLFDSNAGWIDNVNLTHVLTPVPEPTTMVAGALLLLPFGASTLRMLRRKQTA